MYYKRAFFIKALKYRRFGNVCIIICWHMISDFGIANCYLLIGEERALLIDCGLGIGDIKGAVEKITDKPILVVATHGHVDHAGGDGQFEKIYVHTLDTGKTYNFMTNYANR